MISIFIFYTILIASIIYFVFFLYKNIMEQLEYNKVNSSQVLQIKSIYNENKQSFQKLSDLLEKKLNMYQEDINNIEISINDLEKDVNLLKNRDDNLNDIYKHFIIDNNIDQNEISKLEIKIKHVLTDYMNLSYRDFIEKYSNYSFFGLSNYKDIMLDNSIHPNFSEIDIGECLAIQIDREIYGVFIKKGLELKEISFEVSGLNLIYDFNKIPSKGTSYSNWEIQKVPLFKKINTNRWVCIKKGYLNLESKKKKERKLQK